MRAWRQFILYWASVLALATILVLTLNRDPLIELPNGFTLRKTTGNPQYSLEHSWSLDDRPGAHITSLAQDGPHCLYIIKKRETRCFDTREELEQAGRELGPRVPQLGVIVDTVTRFAYNERHIVGHSAEGYFVVDMDDGALELLPVHEAWAATVRTRTELNPDRLRDPHSQWFRIANQQFLVLLGMFSTGLLGLMQLRGADREEERKRRAQADQAPALSEA
ncbi:MAG: hypothetical protein IPM64_00320 [Phycisphaerales bacterium]|nr:hypothetical protein [Phycisphaerales bacterium]